MSQPSGLYANLSGAWYHEEEDGVDAQLFVEHNSEELIVHIDTPEGMISVELDVLDDALDKLVRREALVG